ncbi:MAG TPA: histidine kinase [Flavobacteriales bacterium]|jgi:ligand-binding sensor domain-containing protein|nr:histidine kinase [Flavobacteriales bacterium]
MRRLAAVLLVLLIGQAAVRAQYPLTRTFELRSGQQRPHIRLLAQDAQGILWAASDQGLARSDGERTDLVWSSVPGAVITALCSDGLDVWAALNNGHLLHCRGYACDTVGREVDLMNAPARVLAHGADGSLWIGTYGAGIRIRTAQGTRSIQVAQGLGDDHVNALCPAGNDRMVVATDQGLALCNVEGKVLRRFGESEGAPDNLVLSLAAGSNGTFWAGTHHSGVFRFRLDGASPDVFVPDTVWCFGPVAQLVAGDARVWAGTNSSGVVVLDLHRGLGVHVQATAPNARSAAITGLLRDRDGAVWACDGTERVTRADPHVLVLGEHEGVDLRHVTALCADPRGDLVLATAAGVFRHPAVFDDRNRMVRLPVQVDADRPVVSLFAGTDGTVWMGTFGMGVMRLSPDGRVQRITERDGLCNDNVLAIRGRRGKAGEEVWFATLGGVCMWQPNASGGVVLTVPIPGSRFVYDLLPLADGTVLVATDGNGVIAVAPDGGVQPLGPNGATYYSLCADAQGHAWASGPGTGICKVDRAAPQCSLAGRPPFDGDVFAIAPFGNDLLMFGRNGVGAFDPVDGSLVDVGEALGLAGMDAELNTTCIDVDSALWLACDRGLIRLTGADALIDGNVRAAIMGLSWGDQHLPLDDAVRLRHDQNFLTFRFGAPYYAATGMVRFEYRLLGFDNAVRTTRDREITWSRLPPGDYRFEVRAVLGTDALRGEWAGLPFTIAAPWWRTPWALGAGVLLLTVLFYLFIRAREERMRFRERAEKERVRYQLEALRSQVNPHFLFNSFNTLIDLIEQDQDKAVAHVEHLSDFFREILQVRDKDLIPLAEELKLVDTYFYLEQRRFGERIQLVKHVDNAALRLAVPPLAVQLLVENAIKHNVATAAAPLHIELRADNDMLEVCNTYRPRNEAPRSTGFGIESIQQRYAALTPRTMHVVNEGTHFIVRIPLLPAP